MSFLFLAGSARAGEQELRPQIWQRWKHALISTGRYANPYADVTRRMVPARSAAGDPAAAYLPANDAVAIDMSAFPKPLAASWFDPVNGRYGSVVENVENEGTHHFVPPAGGDWVLLLQQHD